MKKCVLGIITTWEVPCGIATYSSYLLQYFFNSPHYAVHIFACDAPMPQDGAFVHRCWSRHGRNYNELIIQIIKARCEAVIIQHEAAFTSFGELVGIVNALEDHGIRVILELHNCDGSDQHCLAHLPTSCPVLVHDEQNERKLKALHPHPNVHCFQHGSFQRTPLAPQEARAKHRIHGSPVIGIFGFLHPRKNFTAVLDAFDIIKKAHPEAFLLMLTFVHPDQRHPQNLMTHFTQRISSSPYPESFRFCTDFLAEDLIHELLDGVDVTVFPYGESQGQGACSGAVRFPLASNSLIVGSRCPMFDDIGEAVHRYTPNTPEGMAAAIMELMGDSALQAKLHREKKKAVARSSWEDCSRKMEGFLQGLLLASNTETKL